jgi:hypothetical protein
MLHNLAPGDLQRLIAAETQKILAIHSDRFYNVIVGSDWFCKIHSISRPTLQRWIKYGYVIPEKPDEDGQNHRFRLSYILKFDAAAIKGKKFL